MQSLVVREFQDNRLVQLKSCDCSRSHVRGGSNINNCGFQPGAGSPEVDTCTRHIYDSAADGSVMDGLHLVLAAAATSAADLTPQAADIAVADAAAAAGGRLTRRVDISSTF